MEPHLRIGIDVGYKTHRVAIADPDGNILEEFNKTVGMQDQSLKFCSSSADLLAHQDAYF